MTPEERLTGLEGDLQAALERVIGEWADNDDDGIAGRAIDRLAEYLAPRVEQIVGLRRAEWEREVLVAIVREAPECEEQVEFLKVAAEAVMATRPIRTRGEVAQDVPTCSLCRSRDWILRPGRPLVCRGCDVQTCGTPYGERHEACGEVCCGSSGFGCPCCVEIDGTAA